MACKSIVNTVYNKLYTAYGLDRYIKRPMLQGIYIGGPLEGWCLSPGNGGHGHYQFITAYARVYKDDNNLKNNLERFHSIRRSLRMHVCISEIFDEITLIAGDVCTSI